MYVSSLPRELQIANNDYAKFWGVKEVYYGICASRELMEQHFFWGYTASLMAQLASFGHQCCHVLPIDWSLIDRYQTIPITIPIILINYM